MFQCEDRDVTEAFTVAEGSSDKISHRDVLCLADEVEEEIVSSTLFDAIFGDNKFYLCHGHKGCIQIKSTTPEGA